MRTVILAAVLATTAGCARAVDQDVHSGADARFTGAEQVALDRGSGAASGVVTYPGGDRVDWKAVEIPAGQRGTLAVELSWRSPRPGLDLAFDVWDQWGDRLGGVATRTRASGRRARHATARKRTSVAGVHGIVYVEVYASSRRDAGRYLLQLTFTPEANVTLPGFDAKLEQMLAAGLQIPAPPRLATVYPECGDTYDPSNPDCVAHPPPCNRARPDKKNPSCQHLCDEKKLDRDNPDCIQFYPACDPKNWDAGNPKCDDVPIWVPPPPDPIPAAIRNAQIKDAGVQIQFAIAKDSPIAVGWQGDVVDARGKPLGKGHFKVARVQLQKGWAFATVELSLDDVNRNLTVLVYPPAPPTTP